jgi:glycosyltransferase involved in cell wall biosynthesis
VTCPPSGPLAEWTTSAGAIHRSWNANRDPSLQSVDEARRLGSVVRTVAPDLIHLHSSKAGLAGRLVLRGRRCTIFQPHAWSFEAVRGPLRSAAIAWERTAARWTDVILCVSDDERARGEAVGVAGPYRVVPNGIDLDVWKPGDRTAARSRLGLGVEPLVVFVGRLSRQKGQDIAVQAWPAVRSAIADAQLVLVGEGPVGEVLGRPAIPGIRLVGMRTDVAAWLTAADLVIAPSRWEGMSLAVLEAMASGRSVVASDAPGMRQLLGSDAGAVVPVGHPAALAESIVERLRNPDLTEHEGRAGRRRAERHHAVSMSTRSVALLYDELMARREASSHEPRA